MLKVKVCLGCQASFVQINKENRCNECMKEIKEKNLETIEIKDQDKVNKELNKRKKREK